jgi:hypothetical protein
MCSTDCAVSAAFAAKSASTQPQIAIALLAKSQKAAKQQSQTIVALLDTAAQLSKALGKGQQLDVTN